MTHRAEILHRIAELQSFLAGFQPTKLPIEPYPSELREIANDLELFARKVDAVVDAYGAYANANVSGHFDVSLFKDQLFGALDGNALFEITDAADGLQQELAEAVS